MVDEFAELADPVTETGFDGRLGGAGDLGDPGESQGVGGFQADHFGLFFREGCEQPGDSFVFFAEFLIAGVVRRQWDLIALDPVANFRILRSLGGT